MSYEGYTQYLCAAGHLTEVDAYEPIPGHCDCGRNFTTTHQVDETNGTGEPLNLKVVGSPRKCNTCNGVGVIGRTRYRVITNKQEDE